MLLFMNQNIQKDLKEGMLEKVDLVVFKEIMKFFRLFLGINTKLQLSYPRNQNRGTQIRNGKFSKGCGGEGEKILWKNHSINTQNLKYSDKINFSLSELIKQGHKSKQIKSIYLNYSYLIMISQIQMISINSSIL
ncbi:hypothetical protein TTHERM_000079455 (macronuclear) [Tetrahymena thermophila SB210]|uniref:Uncharacterized protein n=1 Tax=Tetrahymena thermophila (strain SB210) TaxID=312017 RepID=W7X521_TETTS|nr:hypothetical protein TTHERM_000079455 [Tetrahymena thermophila SB210]EWS74455.1 hypothetical protein TTHERM_000079455 [Tetrahymena thermophila SB210]|eukprot:XP_012653032.1 hypothetical protein TTHERM_000079455 [Tetrahymena thermophila SB210]